jgi:hypothetical protein
MPRIFVTHVSTKQDQACLEKSIVNRVDQQTVIKSFSDATYPELMDIKRRDQIRSGQNCRGHANDYNGA